MANPEEPALLSDSGTVPSVFSFSGGSLLLLVFSVGYLCAAHISSPSLVPVFLNHVQRFHFVLKENLYPSQYMSHDMLQFHPCKFHDRISYLSYIPLYTSATVFVQLSVHGIHVVLQILKMVDIAAVNTRTRVVLKLCCPWRKCQEGVDNDTFSVWGIKEHSKRRSRPSELH